jgi:hypothetical protein
MTFLTFVFRSSLTDDLNASLINGANKGSALVSIRKANLLEVYYDRSRRVGKDKADLFLAEFETYLIRFLSKPTFEVAVPNIGCRHSRPSGVLLTAEHHEMDKVKLE